MYDSKRSKNRCDGVSKFAWKFHIQADMSLTGVLIILKSVVPPFLCALSFSAKETKRRK